MSEQANGAADVLEACLVAGISMGLAFLTGIILPVFQHPFALVTIGVVAGLASWSRPDVRAAAREHRNLAIAVGVAVLVLLPLLISPSWFGRLLP